MVWFAVFSIFLNGQRQEGQDPPTPHFETRAACMVHAARYGRALAYLGYHGEFLCMYHDEPDAKLATTEKGDY